MHSFSADARSKLRAHLYAVRTVMAQAGAPSHEIDAAVGRVRDQVGTALSDRRARDDRDVAALLATLDPPEAFAGGALSRSWGGPQPETQPPRPRSLRLVRVMGTAAAVIAAAACLGFVARLVMLPSGRPWP